MTRAELDAVTLPDAATLREVLECVDRSGLRVALLVDGEARLAGLLTDGDVRRAILAGADLTGPALPHATTRPQVVPAGHGRAGVLDMMRALRISVVPEVDEGGRPTGVHTLSDVVGVPDLPNPVVIMAGGKGTRLGALAASTPKPLMEVAGRTILEWIVLNLVGGGVREVYVSVNHLAEQVEEHLGDGSRLGCTVHFLREQPDLPLGTAGSLSLLRSARPDLDVPTIVMNGDLMVEFDPEQLLAFHESCEASVTVATRTYQHEVPYGVVHHATDHAVAGISEKPTVTLSVNAGVYAVAPHVLDRVEPGVPTTMPALIQDCLDREETVSAWQLSADWIDVGTPLDLARAKGVS
jgi:dTDP-glucose pyrophosphorylase